MNASHYFGPTSFTLAVALLAGLVGCSTIADVADGGRVSGREIASETVENRKETKELTDRIEENLEKIKNFRKEGNFRAAEYREKYIDRDLKKLKGYAPGHKMLKQAPKRLTEIKEEYTKERYQKKALTAECQENVDQAKEQRMEENWRSVDDNLEDYIKCRRKLKDAGGDESQIAAMDEKYRAEFGKYADYALKQIEKYRKNGRFDYARGFEKGLGEHIKDYKEISDSTDKPDAVAKKMEKIQQAHRDPEVVRAEKAESAFKAWKKNATEAFNKEWKTIKAAEKKAKADYDAGMKALEAGEYEKAVKKLTTARQKLFAAAYPSAVAMDAAIKNGSIERGLSYKISAGIAQAHFENGDKAKLYSELPIIKNGRDWLGKEKELKVRLYDILADRDGELAPKASDPVRRYASRYSDVAQKWEYSKEAAEAATGEAYAMLGVSIETISRYQAGGSPEENAGKVVRIEQPVSAVKGGKLKFDFRSDRKVPTNCWSTGKISHVNAYTGNVYYEQKCNYKDVKQGYILSVPAPEGVDVGEGDVVTFYATVGEKQGDFTVNLQNPGYVRVAPEGTTSWYLGVSVGK